MNCGAFETLTPALSLKERGQQPDAWIAPPLPQGEGRGEGGCQFAPPALPPLEVQQIQAHKAAIEKVVSDFAHAIQHKDKALYMSLFFSNKPEEIGWQFVSEDARLVHIRKNKPDAIKARRIPSNNFVSLIDEAVGTRDSREEKFANVQIDTDGEIASVLFDYEFHASGKMTNWGKEHWQLVRTEKGWKIFSVIYTIRDELSRRGH